MNRSFTGTLLKQFEEEKQIEEETPKITVLKLKPKPRRSVQWVADTVDNEHMNKKKSNICCIYHKPKEDGESSSSTCTSDDEGNPLERSRETKAKHKENCSKYKNNPDSEKSGAPHGGCKHRH
eukprot:TRINITY_DN6375_c0_g1_i3.p1 TRINITY_DN6375_c0_g1~~TRINITY_DN6375_c0_g1_i3.p1  ORF type:complete len:123 (+),score=14.30 TRINITY_DN6375_c0_g1_i3:148-516(+)